MAQEQTYVLEQHERELTRLSTYAEREAEDVRLTCRQVGLVRGQRAIDVGCGPLGALAVLSEIVGETGRVVGLDPSEVAIATARKLTSRLGLQNVALVNGPLAEAETLLGAAYGAFDFVYCRLVLLHQPDPGAFLRLLRGLLRAGGFIAVQDILDDERSPRCEPDVPAQTRVWELILALFEKRGLSPGVARDHRGLAEAQGLRVVAQRGKFAVMEPADGFEIVLQLLIASRAQLIATSLVSAAEVERLQQELEAAKAARYRYWFGPLAIETVLRAGD
jgi:SAM-dependent methyltransferase